MNRASRPRLSRISGSSYASKLLGRAGDGSTLTLDFTTGVLDPRLTFTRLSDATFINSSGRVEWSAANYFRNTGWVTSTTPTGWNVTFGTGTTTWNNDGTLTMNTGGSSTRPCINANSFTVSQGIAYTFGYTVVSVSGSPQVSSVISSTVAGETFAINGTAVVGTTVVQAGDVVSCTFTTTGTTSIPRMGPGVNVGMTNTAMTITRPQMNPGVSLQSYLANSSTTAANNNTPRFDYDPTTGAPRGLLIEGSANNLCLRSEDFGNAVWQTDNSGATNPVVSTVSQTAPNGASSVNRVTLNKTGGTFSRLYQAITGTAGQTYTLSVWMKANTANGGAATQNVGLRIGGSTGINCVVTTTWQRFTHPAFAITGTDANFQLLLWDNIPANDETADVLVWGAQVELGSGASSYIPTGASQGSRAADKMSMTDISTMQWNQTEGTFALHMDVAAETNRSSFPAFMGMYTATPIRVFRFLLNNASGTNPRIGNDTWTAAPTQIVSNLVTRSTAPTAFKFAVSSSNTGQTVNQVVNAGSVTTTSGTGTLQTPTRLLWQQDPSALDTEYFPIHIRSLKYWPTALPNAQLQSLTT